LLLGRSMNVTILEADALSEDTYLSVRAGETKRLRPFRAGEMFSFPMVAADAHKFVQLVAFEKIGAHVASTEAARASENGESVQDIVMELSSGERISTKLRVSIPESPRAAISPGETSKPHTRHRVALDAKNYLDLFDLQTVIQSMLHAILKGRPQDPLSFMMSFLQLMQQGRSCQDAMDTTIRSAATLFQKDAAPPIGSEDARLQPSNDFDEFSRVGDDEAPTCPEVMPDLSRHHSIMTDMLTKDPSIYSRLRDSQTGSGVTFAHCIATGLENPGHPMLKTVGVVAGDEESYEFFRELFNPIIELRHRGFSASSSKHATDLSVEKVSRTCIDSTGMYVLSSRVRSSRNIRGLRMPPACSRSERCEVERTVAKGLLRLEGEDLHGSYFPLRGSTSFLPKPGGASTQEEAMLEKHHFLFHEPDSAVLVSSGLGRHWPEARGVFASDARSLVAWVNEEDHLRLVSLHYGGDIYQNFARFVQAVQGVERGINEDGYEFAHSERLGYIATCPSNLGTGLHASVMLRIPLLSAHPSFHETCRALGLAARGAQQMGVQDISNSERLGSSEVELMNLVIEGCARLVRMEHMLERDTEPDWNTSEPEAHTSGKAADQQPIVDSPKNPSPRTAVEIDLAYVFPADDCPRDMPDLSGHHSLMADVLKNDPSIYPRMKDKVTQLDVRFGMCIKTGMENAGHAMMKTLGVVAGDEECYDVFRELFDPIIEMRHGSVTSKHHPTLQDIGVCDAEIDPSGNYVISARVRSGRNLGGLRMSPACSHAERCEVERVLAGAFLRLDDQDLRGEYFPLLGSSTYLPKPGGMSPADAEDLDRHHFLFQEPDSTVLLSSGVGRDWPEARGVFASKSHQIVMWCNEEDHLRLVSLESGGNLRAAFTRFVRAMNGMELLLKEDDYAFAHSERLGYISTCPSNLGTGLRASVLLRIPRLSAHGSFQESCRGLGLQARSASAPGATVNSSEVGVWDISNRIRLGQPEVELVNTVITGCAELLRLEQALERGEDIL